MAKIENHKYSIAEAFQECFYIVPDYQREYVWTEREVQQLLDDIEDQVEAGTDSEYFIGMVLVSPRTERSHFEVIDGQQRLTTLFLLLCAMRRLFEGDSKTETLLGNLISMSYLDPAGVPQTNLKLDPQYESADELMAKIVELNADPQTVQAAIKASGIATFGSLENILSAYTIVHRHLTDNYEGARRSEDIWAT